MQVVKQQRQQATFHVITREYERSRGQKPRGRKMWIFDIEVDFPGQETITLTGSMSGTYTEALRVIKQDLREAGVDGAHVYIYPRPNSYALD